MAWFSDTFNSDPLNPSWTEEAGTGGSVSQASGILTIDASNGNVDPWNIVELLYQSPIGDFSCIAKFTSLSNISGNWQAAGVVVRLDDNNFVTMHKQYSGGHYLWREDNNGSGDVYSTGVTDTNATIWFKIERAGSDFTCSYSDNGTNFTTISSGGNTFTSSSNSLKVGIFAARSNGSDFTVGVDDWAVTGGGATTTSTSTTSTSTSTTSTSTSMTTTSTSTSTTSTSTSTTSTSTTTTSTTTTIELTYSIEEV